ncbi:hypothetical protein CLV96_3903 [Leptospira meyeri]|uniref:Uncharacterized protein n=1 Tax=Leptospira meyeri TaxID=29508 RepID=A0A4R8MNQ0_LEPME|nr:hypothetical protein [Leptospira meyeri]EKJ86152.1 hypothetical protein LEP1GSC017_0027 [Leptospira meyeri serovar Hardjo str. Went 5]TDY66524.1 hypothetical protein CLV96_3903 [Leptospira meyeri]
MFQTEEALVKKLKRNYSNICYWNTLSFPTKIFEEVDLGFGIADLVISKLKATSINRNSYLNYLDITIYKIIQNNSEISFEQIKHLTRADSRTIKKSISKLKLEKYVKEVNTIYKPGRTYKHFLSDSIAIEAKLKNWRRALNQAYRYKWFASTSYVVLDEKRISSAELNIDLFKEMNVGLACINKKGKVSIRYKPKKEKPFDEKMQMLLNELMLVSYLDRRKDFQIAK